MKELEGIWWTVNQDKVAGKLTITDENKISLTTYGKLYDTNMICGFAQGEKITLVNVELDRTDRISVYHRDKVGKNFRIIARYSSHPKYNHIGRESYDGNKGFISKCWEGDSTDFIKILPETNTDEYLEEQYNVGYEKAELDKLNMNPRLYYVHNIASTNHPSIGVIIIESTQPQLKKYNSINSEEQLRKILAKNMSKFIPYLYDLLDNKQIQKRNDNEK